MSNPLFTARQATAEGRLAAQHHDHGLALGEPFELTVTDGGYVAHYDHGWTIGPDGSVSSSSSPVFGTMAHAK